MFSRCVKDEITRQRLTVESDLTYAFADSVRILDSDFVNGSAETTSYGIFLPLGADAWIDFKAIVCRLYSQDILGDGIPVPRCSTCQPAVLGLAWTSRILARDHLGIYIWFDLVEIASELCV